MGHVVKFYEPPYLPGFLEEIAEFHQHEAGWGTTEFELGIVNPVFALVREEETNAILGTASLNSHTPEAYWLGNVVVAKRARRNGLGSVLVNALVDRAAAERKLPCVALSASKLGAPLYERLGFSFLRLKTTAWYDRPAVLAVPPASSIPVRPASQEDRMAAGELDAQMTKHPSRTWLLETLYSDSKICVVAMGSKGVCGAAWARRTANVAPDCPASVLIGPVVANAPDVAIAVTAGVLRLAGEQVDGDFKASLLGLEQEGSEDSRRVFQALGFVRHYALPFMVKRVDGASEEQTVADFEEVISSGCMGQYAVAGWDLG